MMKMSPGCISLLIATVMVTTECAVGLNIPNIDCSTVSCLLPDCEDGLVPITPPGQCCPVCSEPKCAISGQVFNRCASPCDRTCQNPDPICPTVCVERCECPRGLLLDTTTNRCISSDDCPAQTECPVKGQVITPCGGCDSTCFDVINGETRFCPLVCRGPECSCPGGLVVDTIANACVERDECTNPCSLIYCQSNSVCKVDSQGNAFCEPSCELNNGGCDDDQICKLNKVVCVTSPCPSEVICLNKTDVCSQSPDPGPCEAAITQVFHNAISGQCEKFIYGGCLGNDNRFNTQEECEETCDVKSPDPCDLPPDTGPCKAAFKKFFYNSTSDKCELFIYGGCLGNDNRFDTREECISECDAMNPCFLVDCQPGTRCRVDDQTGEAFCEPSCDIENGGCLKNA